MRRKKIALQFLPLIMIVLLMALPSVTFAASDMFLDLEGIPGEAVDQEHTNEIDVLAFSWSMEMPTSSLTGGGGATAGKVSFSDFCVTKFLDKASVALREKAANGGHIGQARFTVRKSGENPIDFWVVDFTDLLVTKIVFGASSNEDRPTETVYFNYGSIRWGYTPQRDDGTPDAKIEAGWNLEANEGL